MPATSRIRPSHSLTLTAAFLAVGSRMSVTLMTVPTVPVCTGRPSVSVTVRLSVTFIPTAARNGGGCRSTRPTTRPHSAVILTVCLPSRSASQIRAATFLLAVSTTAPSGGTVRLQSRWCSGLPSSLPELATSSTASIRGSSERRFWVSTATPQPRARIWVYSADCHAGQSDDVSCSGSPVNTILTAIGTSRSTAVSSHDSIK